MDIFRKYILNRKYSFFRDYVEIKKELEKHNDLKSLENISGDLEYEKVYLNREVIKNIANFGLISLSIHRSREGVRAARYSLESLSGEEI